MSSFILSLYKKRKKKKIQAFYSTFQMPSIASLKALKNCVLWFLLVV